MRMSQNRLDQLTAQLVFDHPRVNALTERQFMRLRKIAAAQLKAEGVKLPNGVLPLAKQYALRERIAKLSSAH